jgi:SAM-dependent MidA family methyltransferase
MGTLMCHFRHHAHADPLWLPGLNDITAHVDFTAMAEAAHAAGADVLGYATQAQFLINCGLTEVMGRVSPEDTRRYAPLAGAANTLTSPAEMGELFKVFAFGRGVEAPLAGFRAGDKRHTL